MATANKFLSFTEAVMEKLHNIGSDSIKVALSNTLPVNTNTVLANITEISYTNVSTRVLTLTSSSLSSGTYRAIFQDLTLTASGTVGPFRYIIFYNDTATNDELISWYDYGSSITLNSGETFLIDLDNVNGLLSLV